MGSRSHLGADGRTLTREPMAPLGPPNCRLWLLRKLQVVTGGSFGPQLEVWDVDWSGCLPYTRSSLRNPAISPLRDSRMVSVAHECFKSDCHSEMFREYCLLDSAMLWGWEGASNATSSRLLQNYIRSSASSIVQSWDKGSPSHDNFLPTENAKRLLNREFPFC